MAFDPGSLDEHPGSFFWFVSWIENFPEPETPLAGVRLSPFLSVHYLFAGEEEMNGV